MRALLPVAALALLLVLPAAAAPAPFLAAVKAGDSDLDLPLQGLHGSVGYLDGNGNGRPDAALPDEMVYLDLDASATVSYGDVRLTGFDAYAAGTAVDLTNRDVGRALMGRASNAWFGQAGDAWVLDLDGSGTRTVGDVQFTPGPAKVRAADSGLGAPLARPTGGPPGVIGWAGPGPRDPTAPLYVDLDGYSTGVGRVSWGDLRITPLGLAAEPAPPPAEPAPSEPHATLDPQAAPLSPGSSPAAWRVLDWFVVGLGVLNVVGLVAVARRLEQVRPRNPFK